jgi:hypothetical protein
MKRDATYINDLRTHRRLTLREREESRCELGLRCDRFSARCLIRSSVRLAASDECSHSAAKKKKHALVARDHLVVQPNDSS